MADPNQSILDAILASLTGSKETDSGSKIDKMVEDNDRNQAAIEALRRGHQESVHGVSPRMLSAGEHSIPVEPDSDPQDPHPSIQTYSGYQQSQGPAREPGPYRPQFDRPTGYVDAPEEEDPGVSARQSFLAPREGGYDGPIGSEHPWEPPGKFADWATQKIVDHLDPEPTGNTAEERDASGVANMHLREQKFEDGTNKVKGYGEKVLRGMAMPTAVLTGRNLGPTAEQRASDAKSADIQRMVDALNYQKNKADLDTLHKYVNSKGIGVRQPISFQRDQ